jgi:hypothetical protein
MISFKADALVRHSSSDPQAVQVVPSVPKNGHRHGRAGDGQVEVVPFLLYDLIWLLQARASPGRHGPSVRPSCSADRPAGRDQCGWGRCGATVARLMGQIEEFVPAWSMAPIVAASQAMRTIASLDLSHS